MSLVSAVEAPAPISTAIRKASEATGTDFKYLLATAARESNFETQARAKTSSAAGLFQFIENTWLKTVREEGARFGLEKYQPYIFRTSKGRYTVPDRRMREEILALRHDAETSAMMAGAFTKQNADYVTARLGRQPTQGELYIAHFLGPQGAIRLIDLADDHPSARAATHFPKAAAANRDIFYDRGRPRTAEQVYDLLVRDHAARETTALALAAEPMQSRAPETPAQPVAKKALPAVAAKAAADDTGKVAPAQADAPVGLVARTRVAALNEKTLSVVPGMATDVGLGSIGPWRTIVEPAGSTPLSQKAERKTAGLKEAKPEDSTPRRRRSPRSLVQNTNPNPNESAKQPAAPLARARLDPFESNYWLRLGLSGG